MTGWRKIKLCPNYKINAYGEIMNVSTREIVDTYSNGDGIIFVNLLNTNGINKRYRVDMLIAEAFVKTRPNKYYILNYKDGNSTNISPDNLEWIMRPINELTKSELYRNAIIRCVETGKEYYNIYAANDELDVSCKSIADSILYGKTCKTTSGKRCSERYSFEVVRLED